MNNKTRNYIIALGLLLLLLIGIIFYVLFRSDIGPFGPKEPEIGGFPDTDGGGGYTLPPIDGGTRPPYGQGLTEGEKKLLVQISKDPVIGSTIRKDKILYFKRGLGHIFSSPFDGSVEEERLIALSVPNIIDVLWSPSRANVIIADLNDTTARRFWVHFTSTSTIEKGLFPDEITSVQFSPAEEKIAGIVKNTALYTVVTATPQGKSLKTILQTSMPDIELSWASKTLLGLQTRSSAFIPSILQTVPVSGGVASVLLADVRGLDVLWDTNSQRFITLEVAREGKSPTLVLRDRRTPNTGRELSFQTMPEKCVWSSTATSTIYCAIPLNLGIDPLPDSWWQGKVSFNDSLWKIDINTGEASSLLESGMFDITRPILSPKEDYIFFINKKDSMLWSLRLTDTATSTAN